MYYPARLLPATWLKRYKRFLVDVRFPGGTTATAHCANTGSMKGINEPGSDCLVLPVDDPRRKLKFTLEAVHADGVWVGAHPLRANTIAREAVELGFVPELEHVAASRAEVKYGEGSRADWWFQTESGEEWFVEVKSASMKDGNRSLFPDAKTARGRKHLEELRRVVEAGGHAMMLFVATRDDVDVFSPAWDIDPAYCKLLGEAHRAGVHVRAVRSHVSDTEMVAVGTLPVDLDPPQGA